ncbi:MAG: glycine cleavage system protein GcvH [Candidatus Odinarchaeota archaeon]|nr:glycine cleavage system protein GcvH [Candidatus Odinarchaeota archaeon]
MGKYNIQSDRKYQKTHEWVKVDGDIATIGITDFAVDALGGITQIELSIATEDPTSREPIEEGTTIKKGTSIAVIDTAKSTEDVYAPVSGEIVEVNSEIEDDPEVVETSPYEDGWFIKVKISNPEELNELMDAEAYEKHVEEEAKKLGLE